MHPRPSVYVVVLSLGDPVSRTFLELVPEMPLVETRGEIEVRKFGEWPAVVHKGEPTDFNREDLLLSLGKYAIFISRHEMANPRPMFTVHTPGSWPDVSVANPPLATAIFRALCRHAEEPFKCAFEATHHPPNTSAASATFVEVGSTEAEWRDRRAVGVLVQALEEVLGRELGAGATTMVVGDLHYSTVADSALNGEVELGHILPKYLETTLQHVKTAFYKHTTPVRRVVVFRKNVKNPARAEVVEFLREREVEVVLKG